MTSSQGSTTRGSFGPMQMKPQYDPSYVAIEHTATSMGTRGGEPSCANTASPESLFGQPVCVKNGNRAEDEGESRKQTDSRVWGAVFAAGVMLSASQSVPADNSTRDTTTGQDNDTSVSTQIPASENQPSVGQ